MGSQVTVLYRRVKEDMPAIPEEVEEAEKEGVKFLFQAVPTKASGKSGKIQTVECLKTKTGKTGCERPADPDARSRVRIFL